MTSKKKYFKPKNDLSYQNIVDLYNEISKNEYERNSDFVLPQNPKFSSFGNKIAFCQLINTWFRKNPYSKLRIYDNYFPKLQDEIRIVIEKMVKTGELSTLLAISYGIKTSILGYSNKSSNYTENFIKPLENRFIYDYRELTGVSQLTSFSKEYFQIHPDFFDKDFFLYNLPFYLKIGNFYRIKSEIAINDITKKLFSRINNLGTGFTINWLKEIQTYFYEIFDNTYKWGQNNWIIPNGDEVKVEKSNRIFFTSSKNYINIDAKTQMSSFSLDLKLDDFSKYHGSKSNWGFETKILELSILDNGIGIVQTYKKIDLKNQKIDISQEYDYLLEAFRFGSTSDNTFRASIRGIGLNKVIENIKNVFLIIRTGHLYLSRDFGINPFKKEEKFHLFDVSDSENDKSNFLHKIKKYPWAEGTLFTFLIPLT